MQHIVHKFHIQAVQTAIVKMPMPPCPFIPQLSTTKHPPFFQETLDSDLQHMTNKMTSFTAFLRILRDDEVSARDITHDHDNSPSLQLLEQLITRSENAICSVSISVHEQLEVCVPPVQTGQPALLAEPLRFRRDWLVVDAFRNYLQACEQCLLAWPVVA